MRLLTRMFSFLKRKKTAHLFFRDWRALSSIQMARGVLTSAKLKPNMAKTPLPLDSAKRIVVLAPHQDDEAVGAGGLLLLCRKRKIPVTCIFLTDGSADQVVDRNGVRHPRQEWAAIRSEEAQKVCAELDMGFEELGINNTTFADVSDQFPKLVRLLTEISPDVILTPWLLDSACKHRLANCLLDAAVKKMPIPPKQIWGYQVNNPIWANSSLDITAVAEQKQALIRIYESQIDNILRYDHVAMGMNAWNSKELPREKRKDGDTHFAELFSALPTEEHLELTERFYFTDIGRTFFGEPQIAENMEAFVSTHVFASS